MHFTTAELGQSLFSETVCTDSVERLTVHFSELSASEHVEADVHTEAATGPPGYAGLVTVDWP